MTRKAQFDQAKMTDREFQQHALEILRRELGTGGVARFLRTYKFGTGNYTRDRRQSQAGTTVQQIVEDIKKRREKVV